KMANIDENEPSANSRDLLRDALKRHFELLQLGNYVNKHGHLDMDGITVVSIRSPVPLYIFAAGGLQALEDPPFEVDEEHDVGQAFAELDEIVRSTLGDMRLIVGMDDQLEFDDYRGEEMDDGDVNLDVQKLVHLNKCLHEGGSDAWRIL